MDVDAMGIAYQTIISVNAEAIAMCATQAVSRALATATGYELLDRAAGNSKTQPVDATRTLGTHPGLALVGHSGDELG